MGVFILSQGLTQRSAIGKTYVVGLAARFLRRLGIPVIARCPKRLLETFDVILMEGGPVEGYNSREYRTWIRRNRGEKELRRVCGIDEDVFRLPDDVGSFGNVRHSGSLSLRLLTQTFVKSEEKARSNRMTR